MNSGRTVSISTQSQEQNRYLGKRQSLLPDCLRHCIWKPANLRDHHQRTVIRVLILIPVPVMLWRLTRTFDTKTPLPVKWMIELTCGSWLRAPVLFVSATLTATIAVRQNVREVDGQTGDVVSKLSSGRVDIAGGSLARMYGLVRSRPRDASDHDDDAAHASCQVAVISCL